MTHGKVVIADLSRSNSLTDLAVRIKAEHEALAVAMKRGLEHAINAGALLIEAKAQLKHGQWLPWLREHCHIPERTARLYMQLASHAAEIGNVAEMTVRGAMKLLQRPPTEPNWDDWQSISEWAQRMLDDPFTDFDFKDDDDAPLNLDWVKTKLMHQAGVPAIAAWCFDVSHVTEDNRPALRLCPWDELCEAAKVLAPIVSDKSEHKHSLKFDFQDIRSMQGAIAVIQVEAMWMLGGVLNEMKYRETLDDERYEHEWQEVHQQVMARLGQHQRLG